VKINNQFPDSPTDKETISDVAKVVSVSNIADLDKKNVKVTWFVNHRNYSGCLVYRNKQLIAKINDRNTLEYEDNTALPGYNYTYGVSAVLNTPYSSDTSAIVESSNSVQYPGHGEINRIDIVEQADSNRVELYWTYNGKIDFFEIYRLYTLIGVVQSGERTCFFDTTGIPGISYNYRIKGFNNTTGEYTQELTASANFPNLVKPMNLEAISQKDKNKVELNWNYHASNIHGFQVLRNNKLIAYVKDTTWCYSITDTLGLPETIHEYNVMAYRECKGDKYYSEAAMDTAYFPLIEPVSNLSAKTNSDSILTIAWDYPANYNIDGYHVFRKPDNPSDGPVKLAELNADEREYTFKNGVRDRLYQFYVAAFSHRGFDSKEYTSYPVEITTTYPNYPRMEDQSDFNLSNVDTGVVHLDWNYIWEYCDGFILYRNGAVLDTLSSSVTHYVDHSSTCNVYSLYSFRNINGTVYTSNDSLIAVSQGQNTSNYTYEMAYYESSQGKFVEQVKLKWAYNSAMSKPEQVAIYRKEYNKIEEPYSLICNLDNTFTFYMDDDVDDGIKYIYKIKAINSGNQVVGLSTSEGYSKILGTLTGAVKTYETNYPVEGAIVKIKGRSCDSVPYTTYTTTTDQQGSYEFKGIAIPEGDIVYTVSVSFDNHIFVNNDQQVLLKKELRGGIAKDILDLSGIYINGKITNEHSECGQGGVKVSLYYLDWMGNALQTEYTETKNDGSYKFNLRKIANTVDIAVVPDRYHSETDTTAENPIAFWNFDVDKDSLVYPIESLKNSINNADFSDITHYSLNIKIRNTCGWELPNHQFTLAIESSDNCFYKKFETDNYGILNMKLAPANYKIRIVDANPLDLSSKLYVDYFRTRPKEINYLDRYKDFVFNNDTFNYDTTMIFTFHKTPEIRMLNNVGEELSSICNYFEDNNFYIGKTDSTYRNIQIQVVEEFDGEKCPVQDGYVVVTNDGAAATITPEGQYPSKVFVDTVNTNGMVNYGFVGGSPLPVYPYMQSFKVEYLAELEPTPEFLAERLEPILMLGVKNMEGKDVLVNPTEDDEKNEVLLPMFVLRDPPGDQSYSYIEKGTTIKKTFSLSKSEKESNNTQISTSIPLVVVNLIGNMSMENGEQKSNKYDLNATYQFNERLETSKAPLLSTTHETAMQQHYADIIGGVGLAYQVGIGKGIEIKELDDKQTCAIVEFQANTIEWDGVNTQWTYTLAAIDDRLKDLDYRISKTSDSEEKSKLESIRANWLSVLGMYSTQSLPHYDICKIIYQNKNKYPEACNFCEQFFDFQNDTIKVSTIDTDPNSYIDGKLEIQWAPDQINAFNTAIDELSGQLFSIDSVKNPGDVARTDLDWWWNKSANLNKDNDALRNLGDGVYSSYKSDFGNAESTSDLMKALQSQFLKSKVRNETFVAGTGIKRETKTSWFGTRTFSTSAFKDQKKSIGIDACYEVKTFKTSAKYTMKHNTPIASTGPKTEFTFETNFKLAAQLKATYGKTEQFVCTETESSAFGNTQKFGYYFNDNDY
ncbi:MAG: fibronectin type III domain-containing protein, partial [Bacteroidales bacterium]|nr:fibronectin type III domain-containing protein [Bacteroidales bacterium]